MRPLPARLLFGSLAAVALALGALTSHFVFFAAAGMALVFLVSSLRTARVPLARAIARLQGQAVDVRLWGSAPSSDTSADPFVLESVNAIGAGVHVFFRSHSGRAMHLKVAQPFGTALSPDRIVIAVARYVQWNGARVNPVAGTDALVITPRDTRGTPGSVA